jgi:hypothetical protein
MPRYRVRFVTDPDASFEECNGEARPLSEEEYSQNQYFNTETNTPIEYARYLDYYGNPDRHVYLGAILQRQCEVCSVWSEAGSLWNIDCMDDQPEPAIVSKHDRTFGNSSQYFDCDTEIDAIPGYLREVTRDLLSEAREEETKPGRKRSDAEVLQAIVHATHEPATAHVAILETLREEGLING